MFLETVKTINGNREIRRVKTSVILLLGVLFIPLGLFLLIKFEMLFGATLIIFLSPCFLLYPIIRFFVSGGKDSVAAVVTTVIVEEVIKSEIKGAIKKSQPRGIQFFPAALIGAINALEEVPLPKENSATNIGKHTTNTTKR